MNIIIAGGGTGGHLFPGIAIAEEFLLRDRANKVLFIGTQQGLESRIVPQLGFSLQTIAVRRLKGQGVVKKIISLSLIPGAVLQSFRYLRHFKADIVCGVGGYISGPVVVAGALLGMHTVIHEQNSFPGLSNRILGRVVGRVFVSYAESMSFFPRNKTIFTGVPLRKQLSTSLLPERKETFSVVVLGGSQGSQEINQSMMAALPHLSLVKDRICIIHQSGAADVDTLATAYKKFGVQAQIFSFIDDMSGTYARAHLIVSRAGAGTLAEITSCGRAAVLIPYPFAANNHQEKNARVLADSGAALMIPSRKLSGKKLAQVIIDAERDRSQIARMEAQSRALAKPRAAQEIVDQCYALVGQQESAQH